MAKLSLDDVLKLARLARLELTDAEVKLFVEEISNVLEYVEQLQNVDVSGLEPTNQVTGLSDIMRPDEIKSYGYEPLDLLKNVPAVEDNQIKVRRVL